MSGETTERPFSRTILGAISATCFTLFGAGLVLWMQTVTIGALHAYTFMAIMTAVFLLSMVVAARSGRYSASSYGWKQWTAVVIPILLLVRITAFFGSGTDSFEDPIRFLSGLLDLTALYLALVLALTWGSGMRVARNIELLHPQRSEIPPSMRSPQLKFHNVFVFPGVPELVRNRFASLKELFRSGEIFLRQIYLNTEEGCIAEALDATNAEFSELMLGSYPALWRKDYTLKLTLESRRESYLDDALEFLMSRLSGEKIIRVE